MIKAGFGLNIITMLVRSWKFTKLSPALSPYTDWKKLFIEEKKTHSLQTCLSLSTHTLLSVVFQISTKLARLLFIQKIKVSTSLGDCREQLHIWRSHVQRHQWAARLGRLHHHLKHKVSSSSLNVVLISLIAFSTIFFYGSLSISGGGKQRNSFIYSIARSDSRPWLTPFHLDENYKWNTDYLFPTSMGGPSPPNISWCGWRG